MCRTTRNRFDSFAWRYLIAPAAFWLCSCFNTPGAELQSLLQEYRTAVPTDTRLDCEIVLMIGQLTRPWETERPGFKSELRKASDDLMEMLKEKPWLVLDGLNHAEWPFLAEVTSGQDVIGEHRKRYGWDKRSDDELVILYAAKHPKILASSGTLQARYQKLMAAFPPVTWAITNASCEICASYLGTPMKWQRQKLAAAIRQYLLSLKNQVPHLNSDQEEWLKKEEARLRELALSGVVTPRLGHDPWDDFRQSKEYEMREFRELVECMIGEITVLQRKQESRYWDEVSEMAEWLHLMNSQIGRKLSDKILKMREMGFLGSGWWNVTLRESYPTRKGRVIANGGIGGSEPCEQIQWMIGDWVLGPYFTKAQLGEKAMEEMEEMEPRVERLLQK